MRFFPLEDNLMCMFLSKNSFPKTKFLWWLVTLHHEPTVPVNKSQTFSTHLTFIISYYNYGSFKSTRIINWWAFALLLAASNQHLWQAPQRIPMRRLSPHFLLISVHFLWFEGFYSHFDRINTLPLICLHLNFCWAAGWDGLGNLCVGVGRETSPNLDAAYKRRCASLWF